MNPQQCDLVYKQNQRAKKHAWFPRRMLEMYEALVWVSGSCLSSGCARNVDLFWLILSFGWVHLILTWNVFKLLGASQFMHTALLKTCAHLLAPGFKSPAFMSRKKSHLLVSPCAALYFDDLLQRFIWHICFFIYEEWNRYLKINTYFWSMIHYYCLQWLEAFARQVSLI